MRNNLVPIQVHFWKYSRCVVASSCTKDNIFVQPDGGVLWTYVHSHFDNLNFRINVVNAVSDDPLQPAQHVGPISVVFNYF